MFARARMHSVSLILALQIRRFVFYLFGSLCRYLSRCVHLFRLHSGFAFIADCYKELDCEKSFCFFSWCYHLITHNNGENDFAFGNTHKIYRWNSTKQMTFDCKTEEEEEKNRRQSFPNNPEVKTTDNIVGLQHSTMAFLWYSLNDISLIQKTRKKKNSRKLVSFNRSSNDGISIFFGILMIFARIQWT